MTRLEKTLGEHGACAEGIAWAKQFRSPAAAWEAC